MSNRKYKTTMIRPKYGIFDLHIINSEKFTEFN